MEIPALAFPTTHLLMNVAIAFLANHPDRMTRVVKTGWKSRITVLIVCQRVTSSRHPTEDVASYPFVIQLIVI